METDFTLIFVSDKSRNAKEKEGACDVKFL